MSDGPTLDGATEMFIVHDDISNRLDEMADLCEHWKRWREKRNFTPYSIRGALIMLAGEVTSLNALEKVRGPRTERVKQRP